MDSECGNAWVSDATVLLVEDEEALRQMLRTLLELQGCTVLEAADGPTALRMVTEHPGPIHLLLSDVVLPGGFHGPDLAEALARQRPGAAVLLTSGHTDDRVVGHGLRPESMQFLRKPFSVPVLMEKLQEILLGTGQLQSHDPESVLSFSAGADHLPARGADSSEPSPTPEE